MYVCCVTCVRVLCDVCTCVVYVCCVYVFDVCTCVVCTCVVCTCVVRCVYVCTCFVRCVYACTCVVYTCVASLLQQHVNNPWLLASDWPRPPGAPAPPTVVVLEEDGDGERTDLVLGAGGEGGVHGAHDAQRLHHQGQDLRAELGGQLDQTLQHAGQEGLQHVGALRELQLVAVAGWGEGGG